MGDASAMTELQERWAAVARLITARMKQLRLTRKALMEISGLSDPTVRQYMTGQPRQGSTLPERPRDDTLQPLADALRWESEWWERIVAGEEPATWEDELREARRELELATFAMETRGGREEGQDYRWWTDRVADLEARNNAFDGPVAKPSPIQRQLALINERLARLEMLTPALVKLREDVDALQREMQSVPNPAIATNEQFATAARDGTVTDPPPDAKPTPPRTSSFDPDDDR